MDLVKRADEALKDVTPGPWAEFIDDSGGKWTGWPLSIDATSITDKTVVRTGGQWPYSWDALTSQQEAVANARFIAAARELVPAMRDRIEADAKRIAVASEKLRVTDEAAASFHSRLIAAEARVRELEQRDAEAATHVESVIAMRTGFTGDPPYVGWKGLGLALTEALDARDAAEARVKVLEDALRALLDCPHIAERDMEPAWMEPETEEAVARALAALEG